MLEGLVGESSVEKQHLPMTLVGFPRQRQVWRRETGTDSHTICINSRNVGNGRGARRRANREVGRECRAERGERISRKGGEY